MKKVSIILVVVVISLSTLISCNGSDRVTCVGEGTLIATPYGATLIERLQIGDIVISPDPLTNTTYFGRVTAIRTDFRQCLTFSLEGGGELLVTQEHPLWDPVAQKFKPAGTFRSSSSVTVSDGQLGDMRQLSIVAISGQHVMKRVYDLTISSPAHTFIANGVVVHNKTPPLTFIILSSYEWLAHAGGGDTDIAVSSNEAINYSVSVSPSGSWLSVSANSGMTPSSIIITAAANSQGTTRSGQVIITADADGSESIIEVTQQSLSR